MDQVKSTTIPLPISQTLSPLQCYLHLRRFLSLRLRFRTIYSQRPRPTSNRIRSSIRTSLVLLPGSTRTYHTTCNSTSIRMKICLLVGSPRWDGLRRSIPGEEGLGSHRTSGIRCSMVLVLVRLHLDVRSSFPPPTFPCFFLAASPFIQT